MTDLKNKIQKILQNAKPWERVPTTVDGLFLIKAPARGGQESVMVELNPMDESGKPIKRRGLFLTNEFQLNQFRDLLKHEEVDNILQAIQTEKKTHTRLEL